MTTCGEASPFGNADELNHLVENSIATKIIQPQGERAWMYVYPLSLGEP